MALNINNSFLNYKKCGNVDNTLTKLKLMPAPSTIDYSYKRLPEWRRMAREEYEKSKQMEGTKTH